MCSPCTTGKDITDKLPEFQPQIILTFLTTCLIFVMSLSTRVRCRRSTRITSSLWWPKSFLHIPVWCSAPPRRTVRTLQGWSANIWKSRWSSRLTSSALLSTVRTDSVLFSWLLQGVPPAQGGGEGRPPQRAEGQRERLGVSGAQEDCAVWFGLSPQRTDHRGEETGGGGVLQRGPLSAHLHLHPGCRDQPTSPQVSHRYTDDSGFLRPAGVTVWTGRTEVSLC